MPEINIKGGKLPYTREQRNEAEYENREVDLRAKKVRDDAAAALRSEKALANQRARDAAAQAKAQREAARLAAKTVADQIKQQKALDAVSRKTAADQAKQAAAQQKAADLAARQQAAQARQVQQAANAQAKQQAAAAKQAQQAANAQAKQQATAARQAQQAANAQARQQAQQQRQAATQARQAASQASAQARVQARSDPETYIGRGIQGLGRQGASAATSGEWQQKAATKRRLARIRRRTQAEMRGASGGRLAALQSRLGSIGEAEAEIGGASELEALGSVSGMSIAGPLGMAAMGLYEGVKFAASAPRRFAGYATGLQAAASPYTSLKLSAADMGRANNFNGAGLLARLGANGGAVPAWLLQTGMTAQDALAAASGSGLAFAGASDAESAARAMAFANRMPGLAGLGVDRLGQSLNVATTLGATVRDPFSGATVGMGSNRFDATAGGTSLDKNTAYLTAMSRAVAQGTMLGLDKSQSISNLESLFQQTAAGGANQVNTSALMDGYMRMAGGGNAQARTGQEQASVQSALQSSIAGLGTGGDPRQAFVIQSRLAQTGGLPKSRAGLAKFFGITNDQLASYTSTPSGAAAVDYMMKAAQAGNGYAFSEYAKSFLNSNTDLYGNMVQGSALVQSLPAYMRPIGYASVTGMTTQAGIESRPGFASTTATGSGTASQRAFLDAISYGEANSYNELNGGGTFSGSAFPNAGKAAGRYQFVPKTWREVARRNGFTDFSPSTQDAGAWSEASRVYALKTGRSLATDINDPSNLPRIRAALQGTWTSLQNTDDATFANRFNMAFGQESKRADNQSLATNDTARLNAADATTGALVANAGRQADAQYEGVLGGQGGGVLVGLSSSATDATNALFRLAPAVDAVISHLRGIAGASSGGGATAIYGGSKHLAPRTMQSAPATSPSHRPPQAP